MGIVIVNVDTMLCKSLYVNVESTLFIRDYCHVADVLFGSYTVDVVKHHPGKEFAWSPDSKHLAFNGPDGKIISIMSIEDGHTINIESGLANSDVGAQVDWSPDGKRFVFKGGTGEGCEFWMMENFLPLNKLVQKNEKENKFC